LCFFTFTICPKDKFEQVKISKKLQKTVKNNLEVCWFISIKSITDFLVCVK